MAIKFYTTKGEYGYLSNFYPAPIEMNGKIFKTVEHYFQSQKFAGTKWEEYIRNLPTPKEAANFGRKKTLPLRKDWEEIKITIIKSAVLAKFTQHRYLKEKLLETGDEELVEESFKDFFWGNGGDGSGKNMLGKVLMEVREEIKNEKAKDSAAV